MLEEDTFETTPKHKRASPNRSGAQQVSRLPHLNGKPLSVGDWVRVKAFSGTCSLLPRNGRPQGHPHPCYCGRVVEIISLHASKTKREQKYVEWFIHLRDGRRLNWHDIERFATDEEIERAKAYGP